MKLNKGTKAVIYALLILVAVYFLFPFVYMFFSAFKTEAEINAIPPSLFPKKFLWSNFVNAWQSQEFGTFLQKFHIGNHRNDCGSAFVLLPGCLWVCQI